MFKLFRKNNKYPPFRLLWTFEKRDYYFLRNAHWTRLDNEAILVTIPHSLESITLKGWQMQLFLSATGTFTVAAYVRLMADQYEGNIPDTLDQVIVYELVNLAELQLIRFTKTINPSEQEFDTPGFIE